MVLRWVSKLTPVTIPAVSFRNVMIKGWEIQNFEVYIGLVVEVGWIVFLSITNLFLMKKGR